MQLFLKKLINVSILVFLCILFFSLLSYFIFHKKNKNFLASYELKVDKLEKTKGKRRIIVLGGSNVVFSLDSRLLKDSLDIEVINAGLHGGIGLKNEVDLFYSFIDSSKDIIVISPEFETLFNFSPDFESEEAVYCKSLRPLAFPKVNILLYFLQRNNPVTYLKEIAVSRDRTIYHKDNFNAFGDISHYPAKRKYTMYLRKKNKIVFNSRYNDAITYIKSKFSGFNYFVVSPVIHPVWNVNELMQFDQSMQLNFDDRYILQATALSPIFNRSDFYNTIYHPNIVGKNIYSNELLKAIRNAISK